jgi:hypothetical protein
MSARRRREKTLAARKRRAETQIVCNSVGNETNWSEIIGPQFSVPLFRINCFERSPALFCSLPVAHFRCQPIYIRRANADALSLFYDPDAVLRGRLTLKNALNAYLDVIKKSLAAMRFTMEKCVI